MAEAHDPERWKRLGRMLEQQRVTLDTRYANHSAFTRERGIDYRLSWDIEHGARDNYRRPTITAIEIAYGLTPGSITAFLDGQADSFEMPSGPYDDDPELDQLWRTTAGLPEDRRHAAIELAREMRKRSRARNEKASAVKIRRA